MAASSSAASLLGIREVDQNQMNQQQSSTPSSSTTPAAPPQKKRRNQHGTPYPDAEVIAISPKTLMATNRFICEVCNKGFQREQNLQLHRRGHNLPWKLKQKSTKEQKRKVYMCPEPTCVHHDPSRALGDLTGIKKHYSRKHGEKKWKCEKCSKKYAVQSDWKAHSKTCGTREYRCDCGTLFSRRDSFITHRAFCDALAHESARQQPNLNSAIGSQLYGNSSMTLAISQVGSINDQNNHQSGDQLCLRPTTAGQFDHILQQSLGSSTFKPLETMHSSPFFMPDEPNQNQNYQNKALFQGLLQLADLNNNHNNNPFCNINSKNNLSEHINNDQGSNFFSIMSDHNQTSTTTNAPSLFSSSVQHSSGSISHMSATALLQKAAQMGASSSNNNNTASSILRSFRSTTSNSDQRPLSSANFDTIFSGNNNNLQELMNSFVVSGNSPILENGSSSSSAARFSTGFEAYDNNSINREPKLHSVSIGGSDKLSTRDFLGVGQIVRSMSGGVSHREQQQQQQNTAPSDQSFGDGGNFLSE
ncbi:PREDICTED: protein indeterminate-domain 5, chloroplastic-like isoform X1 [Lupinus angustifolius]|uniref:protein indeterminate-domain 5, chloroplastic-like isoform X1 n=1 Tax=Lupinus angustifolius TaxID=3871 RepID=UPI00092FD389|nr:PREDICTED: protein indeterminate-domain 5, chloroplastic-like isoform X1 [Lupinus angustifolius]